LLETFESCELHSNLSCLTLFRFLIRHAPGHFSERVLRTRCLRTAGNVNRTVRKSHITQSESNNKQKEAIIMFKAISTENITIKNKVLISDDLIRFTNCSKQESKRNEKNLVLARSEPTRPCRYYFL